MSSASRIRKLSNGLDMMPFAKRCLSCLYYLLGLPHAFAEVFGTLVGSLLECGILHKMVVGSGDREAIVR